jgi:hypothetical protein
MKAVDRELILRRLMAEELNPIVLVIMVKETMASL